METIEIEDQIPEGSCRVINVKGREIGVFKVRGKFYAMNNWCAHSGGPVCTGKISGTLRMGPETNWKLQWVREGEIVTCPWHGLEYDITTGQCIALKAYRLRTYPVKVADGRVKIEIQP